jgi:hypothetical protein
MIILSALALGIFQSDSGDGIIQSVAQLDEGVVVQLYDPNEAGSVFDGKAWQSPEACGPNSGNCVEVNLGNDGLVGLRDSKIPDSPVLIFDDAEWGSFLDAASAGQFRR